MSQTSSSHHTPSAPSPAAAPLLPITISISGHRDIANPQAVRSQLQRVLQDIRNEFEHTPLQALSPLAEGADRLFAETCLEAGLPLDVVLPLPQAIYEQDFPQTVAEFRSLLARARHIGTLPFVGNNDAQTVTHDPDARNLQYAQVGFHVASRAQILIAVWDGQPARGLGGTAQVVHIRLAGHLQEEVTGFTSMAYFLQPSALDTPPEGLVCWIQTRRSGQHGSADAEAPRWLTSPKDLEGPFRGHMHGPVREQLEELDTYNGQLHRFWEKASASVREEILNGKVVQHMEGASLAQQVYRQHLAADALANANMQNVRAQFKEIFLLAGGMAATFEIWAHVWPTWYVLLVYLVLIGVIGWRIRGLRRTEANEHAVDWRVLAEGLRIQAFWIAAGIPDPVVKHYMRRHGQTMRWVRTALSGIFPVLPDTTVCVHQAVLDHWIEDQYGYFQRSVQKRSAIINQLLSSSAVFYALAVIMAIGVFVASIPIVGLIGEGDSPVKGGLIATLGLLPALSGLLASYIEFSGYKDDVREHTRMAQLFDRAKAASTRLLEARDARSFQNLVRDLGQEALREQADWALLHKSHELEIPKG